MQLVTRLPVATTTTHLAASAILGRDSAIQAVVTNAVAVCVHEVGLLNGLAIILRTPLAAGSILSEDTVGVGVAHDVTICVDERAVDAGACPSVGVQREVWPPSLPPKSP